MSSRRSRAGVTSPATNRNRSSRQESWRESGATIRAGKRFWRARMRRDAGGHENFLIAKNCDSESTRRALRRCSRLTTAAEMLRSHHASNTQRPSAIGFAAILTNASAGNPRTIRIAASMHRGSAVRRAPRALSPARQHFLKPDTVFFDVLVYSGCSAFRFPSARSDKAISLH